MCKQLSIKVRRSCMMKFSPFPGRAGRYVRHLRRQSRSVLQGILMQGGQLTSGRRAKSPAGFLPGSNSSARRASASQLAEMPHTVSAARNFYTQVGPARSFLSLQPISEQFKLDTRIKRCFRSFRCIVLFSTCDALTLRIIVQKRVIL